MKLSAFNGQAMQSVVHLLATEWTDLTPPAKAK
jgi:hypothetical protein